MFWAGLETSGAEHANVRFILELVCEFASMAETAHPPGDGQARRCVVGNLVPTVVHQLPTVGCTIGTQVIYGDPSWIAVNHFLAGTHRNQPG